MFIKAALKMDGKISPHSHEATTVAPRPCMLKMLHLHQNAIQDLLVHPPIIISSFLGNHGIK
jgi:hypothetical protein